MQLLTICIDLRSVKHYRAIIHAADTRALNPTQLGLCAYAAASWPLVDRDAVQGNVTRDEKADKLRKLAKKLGKSIIGAVETSGE